MNKHITKENVQLANKHIKRSVVIREMQNETTVGYHYTPIGTNLINLQTFSADWDEHKHTYAAGRNIKH